MLDIKKYFLAVEKPAQYLGNELNSIHKDDFKARMCLVFPDLYEIGMSSVGLRILYNLINRVDDFYLERAFCPMEDMEKVLRENDLPMFSLESKTPLSDFDIVGFSLSYELSYTNVLNMLDLAKIPLLRDDRDESHPLIMAGGTCTMNPAPMEDFLDFFVIGDGEDVMPELGKIFVENCDKSKSEKLELIKDIDGVYIPSLHKGKRVKKAVVEDLNRTELYTEQLVPYIDIVHDRAVAEIQRGCTRGCRFCQAGMVYRPVRERSLENNIKLIEETLNATGYSEISLSSLSSSDYTKIGELLGGLQEKYSNDFIGVSLPSLRMNPHSVRVAESIQTGKKTGFTFAPEAGSQRLRDVINKGVTEEEILETAEAAIKAGWQNLKFYFMIGLPFETDEDIKGIHDLVVKVTKVCRQYTKRLNITVSVSNFVPKPHTPFQWASQMDFEEMKRKHTLLREIFKKTRYTSLKIHDMKTSYLEGIISRGDNRIGKLIKLAYENGAKFDGWRKYFKFDVWMRCMDELGLDPKEYLGERELDQTLAWDKVDIGVTKEFYLKELGKAEEEALTPDCRESCAACGIKTRIAKCGNLVSDKLK